MSTQIQPLFFIIWLREVIAEKIADDVPFDGEIEVDESFWWS